MPALLATLAMLASLHRTMGRAASCGARARSPARMGTRERGKERTSLMGTKVCKFGGTSLADASQFRKVAAIVAADSARRAVVPSAPGRRHDADPKVTDLLYICQTAAARGAPFDAPLGAIRARFASIVSDLGIEIDLASDFDAIEAALASGASPAFAASRGEYLSGKVLAALLHFTFVDAASVIRFDRAGRLEREATREALVKALSGADRVIVPGFYGADETGAIHTFSRGGSDVTGALVARALEADVYENWTDVPGVLMADPRIVPNPGPIPVLTYRELRELSYMGATVLHEDAIFPVREAGIPVHIRNTNEPDAPGTRIVRADIGELPPAGRITGIAGRKDFTILAIEKTLMNAEVGFGRRMLGVLEDHGVPFEHLPSGIDTMSLVVRDAHLGDKLEAVCDEIERVCMPDSLEVYRNFALIATVGRGMMHTPGMAARLFSALADARINVRMIDQGSSELNIIVGVEAADFEAAVRAIHAAFTGTISHAH
jgi:aspartate kinase